MLSRRQFVASSAAFLTTPVLLKNRARAQQLRVRRDVMDMQEDDPFFAKYAEAVRKMHDLPADDRRNWRNQAIIHADFCPHPGVGGTDFLQWHRHYITFFERICGEMVGDPDFALPYWNWSKNSGKMPAPFFDRDELNVEFWNDRSDYDSRMWGRITTIPARALTKDSGLTDDQQTGGPFTLENIERIKRLPDFSDFHRSLDNPHGVAHSIIGSTPAGRGHMGFGLSSLDPIFWLHHCMVDRIWAQWQRAGNTSVDPGRTYEGVFADQSGNPVTVSAVETHDHEALGFTYDVLAEGQIAAFDVPANSFFSAQQEELAGIFAAATRVTLGEATNDQVSRIEQVTAINVGVQSLGRELLSERVFRPTDLFAQTFAVEQGRVLARLTEVTPPGPDEDALVNVFVECPYLTSETPYTDPHYAGTFSFFGRQGGEHPGHEGGAVVIDITQPVRFLAGEGRLDPATIGVQLMPLAASERAGAKAEFKVGKVEIVSA